MNAHAVQVEAGYQRPVMSAFHALFSIGGVLASLLAAGTLSWGWSPATTLTAVNVVSLVVAVVCFPRLLAKQQSGTADADVPSAKPSWRSTPPRIWILAALALILMLSEGAAADWSALAMRDVLPRRVSGSLSS